MSVARWPKELHDLIEGLVGRTVVVRPLTAPTPPWFALAEYRDANGRIEGFHGTDAELSAGLAAALSLVPAGVAQQAAKAKKLPPALLENLHEVFNVAGRLVQDEQTARALLHAVHVAPGQPSAEAAAAWKKPRLLADYSVQITGYPSGIWSIRMI